MRQKIVGDFRGEYRKIDRRASGMGTNEGRTYRRAKTQELYADLAEEYDLSIDTVKRITSEIPRR